MRHPDENRDTNKIMATKVKNKTHKSTARRFKVTATGKVQHRSQHIRHLRSAKSKKQMRALKQMNTVEGKMEKKILQMLGQA